jgi:hypothetical protein
MMDGVVHLFTMGVKKILAGWRGVSKTGVLCAPEWKDGLDNARHEQMLEAVRGKPYLDVFCIRVRRPHANLFAIPFY